MRQNIRRSLTDILYKRVSDSDDLSMSENEVSRLAVSIEKEMFNLYMSTDSKYKNKYRSLMFNLKDPKNKGLFYRVVGGEVSPFRLVRLSAEELLSKEVSGWRKMENTEEDRPTAASASGTTSVSNTASKTSSTMPDFFSSMLQDTTAEHRAHLFDLNCKICTGQKSADEEPAPKKPKLSIPKKPEVKAKLDSRPQKPLESDGPIPQSSSTTPVPDVLASTEDISSVRTPPQASVPPALPAVSSVTITRRDPRTAVHRSTVTVTKSVPDVTGSGAVDPPVVDSGLKCKQMFFFFDSAPENLPPAEGETALFLSSQEMMWKGFINMHSVAKFVTKAYLVSGSFEHLKEDLPDTIHIGGRISPHTVWDYVGKLKTSLSKELCLIRFHPATEEEEVAYVSLFSYFSSRKRFGVVANNNRRIKDLYLIPLSSKDPLPSKLLPFEGPGKHGE
uniref:TFIIS central domain-containing protein n=1 Tax=Denticeps clupeoides TaxID=299321 RepID=A0AAY4EAH9_9TELE